MASVTLDLPEDTRRRLSDMASRNGQPLEVFIRGVLEAEAGAANGTPPVKEAQPEQTQSVEDFDRWLADLEKLPPIALPAGTFEWSREDIYFDHD